MVLGKVHPAVSARDLHIERKAVAEPVLPIDAKAEEAHVEVACLCDVKNPQDRNRGTNLHRRSLWARRLSVPAPPALEIVNDRARCVMARRAGDATAWMGARPAQVKP